MAWTNIFEHGEWDVYVQYVGITENPVPDSRYYMVRAEELDPGVGTVTVTPAGLIECNFEDRSGSGGRQPAVFVMPRTPISKPVRLTCSGVDDFGDFTRSELLADIAAVVDLGGGEYEAEWAEEENFATYADASEWLDPLEAPSVLSPGCGIGFLIIAAGA